MDIYSLACNMHKMNETECKTEDLLEKKDLNCYEGLKKTAKMSEENYLRELMSNSKSIQRMEDFIRTLDQKN